ncbi:hypothetical protein GCM10027589_31950 [Actinocorallia lasiicapitis]
MSHEEECVTQLELLADRLRADGWRVENVGAASRTPRLLVVNPETEALNDTVTFAAAPAGSWEFRYSWEQAIGPVGDIEGAAAQIARVLGGSR